MGNTYPYCVLPSVYKSGSTGESNAINGWNTIKDTYGVDYDKLTDEQKRTMQTEEFELCSKHPSTQVPDQADQSNYYQQGGSLPRVQT